MNALGFFPMLPRMAPKVANWTPLLIKNTTIFHKRSPHFCRDYIITLPSLKILPAEYSEEAKAIESAKQRLVNNKAFDTLESDLAAKLDDIGPKYLAVANTCDQFELPHALTEYLAELLKLPWECVYNLCPLVPNWESGRHFDVLHDEWP